MSALRELLERVSKATGPDRKLDSLIAMVTRDGADGYPDKPLGSSSPGYAQADLGPGDGWSVGWRVAPYTASLDASIALVERRLPGWVWSVMTDYELPGRVRLYDAMQPRGPLSVKADGATPALAVCAALLTALIAQETGR